MLDTAEYLEQRGELDKAVLLYQKAGRQRRAVELCFRAQLFDTLQAIADSLDQRSDPALLQRCGESWAGCAWVLEQNNYQLVRAVDDALLQRRCELYHHLTVLRAVHLAN